MINNIPALPIHKETPNNLHNKYIMQTTNVSFSGFRFPLKLDIFEENKSTQKSQKQCIVATIDPPEKSIDIDGDNIPDIAHSLVSHLIIKKNLPDCKVLYFRVHETSKKKIPLQETTNQLNRIADKIEKDHAEGKKTIQAVNLSITLSPPEIKQLNDTETSQDLDLTSYQTWSLIAEKDITPSNIKRNRDGLRKIVLKSKSSMLEGCSIKKDFNPRLVHLRNAVQAIERITKKGIPVFVAAGNSGSDLLSPLSLANGVITVGASDFRGDKAEYSAKNSLISSYEIGRHPIKFITEGEAIKGFNISKKNNIDIPITKISSGRFVGRSLDEVLADDYTPIKKLGAALDSLDPVNPDPDALKMHGVTLEDFNQKIKNKIFRIDEIEEVFNCMSEEMQEDGKWIDPAKLGDYTDFTRKFIYKTDKNGKIILTYIYKGTNPDNPPRAIIGTSCSTPEKLSLYMRNTHR